MRTTEQTRKPVGNASEAARRRRQSDTDRLLLRPGSAAAAEQARRSGGTAPQPATAARVADYASVPARRPGAPRTADRVLGNSASDDAILGGVVGALAGGAIGAGIGFAVGGPIGALVGGLIGLAVGGAAGAGIGYAAGSAGGGAANAGNLRSVDIQPVVFRDNAADAAPTGTTLSTRLATSNTVWGKLGVTFSASTAVTIDDPTLKTSGTNLAEYNSVVGSHSDASKVCVFFTNNDYAFLGGGGTIGGGAGGAKIAVADRGTSDTLLAHELGHALGLGHPPTDADANTIMTPSGSHSAANPTRNTMGNYRRITWPAPGAATTLNPDP